MGDVLGREMILAADDRMHKAERVSVPEWGGDVFIAPMTGADNMRFTKRTITDVSADGGSKVDVSPMALYVVGYSLVDDRGRRLFRTDKAIESELGRKSGAVITRLSEIANRINGLSGDDEKPDDEATDSEDSDFEDFEASGFALDDELELDRMPSGN